MSVAAMAVGAVWIALQLLVSWSLQAIATKLGQPAAARLLAWLPPLCLYTLIRCGGASASRFAIALGAACAASAVIAPATGTLALAIAWGVGGLLCVGTLMWRIAERRGLPGAVGLLTVMPGLNLAALPYIAFHDGRVAPQRLGVVLGLSLAAALSLLPHRAVAPTAALPHAAVVGADALDDAELDRAFANIGLMMQFAGQMATPADAGERRAR